ncbi:glyoxalase superfamily protein [Acidovorax sp. FG27]|uniref:glyoxalase superfamily protein n=1 Tax=Acidovorax sp. FG27 TaxID=3133652 RepID=UPI0030EAD528
MPSSSHLPLPTKEQIALLPLFEGLDLDRIRLIRTDDDAVAALRALIDSPVLGFDTESKPTFVRGDVSDGPHLVQFATLEQGWLFQLATPGCRRAVQALLAAPHLVKAGFGLDNDRSQLARSLGGPVHALLDLDTVLRRLGYPRSMGVKTAIALLFGQRFAKSKKIGTSNWAQPQLTDAQQRYAANDAYAALRVYEALQAASPARPLLDGAGADHQGATTQPPARPAGPRGRSERPARQPAETNAGPAPSAALQPAPGADASSDAQSLQVRQSVPVLRIDGVDEALRFYVGLLGFSVNWRLPDAQHGGAEATAEPAPPSAAPRYLQVSRAGCVLHLSEDERDGTPGAMVVLRCEGLVAFHAELTARGYATRRPGVEKAPWGGDLMTLTDPFGNRLRFLEE